MRLEKEKEEALKREDNKFQIKLASLKSLNE